MSDGPQLDTTERDPQGGDRRGGRGTNVKQLITSSKPCLYLGGRDGVGLVHYMGKEICIVVLETVSYKYISLAATVAASEYHLRERMEVCKRNRRSVETALALAQRARATRLL